MISIQYFLTLILLNRCKCLYRNEGNNDVSVDELQNNLEMFVRPIQKLTGIFPNHEIEVQFDIEPKKKVAKQRRRVNLKEPTYETETSTSSKLKSGINTIDPDNQIVYIKDLKKAFEDFEKKYDIKNNSKEGNCNQQSSSSNAPAYTTTSGSNLQDIINMIKNRGQMQKDVPRPNNEELSWLKIQLPA